jgi:hypothetical protein
VPPSAAPENALRGIPDSALVSLAAAGLWFPLFPALNGISILAGIWLIRPPDTQGYAAQ